MQAVTEKEKIDRLVGQFYGVFSNKGNRVPRVDTLYELFVQDGRISRVNPEGDLFIYTLEEFIHPRQEILNNGRLVDFTEYETHEKTEIGVAMAVRQSRYVKLGVMDGDTYNGSGTKSMQFVKAGSEWRFLAVLWEDDI